MEALNLPTYDARLREHPSSGQQEIWDTQRKRWVKLTPEEWVRQHFVHMLIEQMQYPMGRIGNEIAIRVGQTEKRCDSVVFGNEGQPVMIIEYKAPTVKLSQKTFDQICRYNLALQVDWLIVSNGLQHFCCHLDKINQRWMFLRGLPAYQDLILQSPEP